MNRKELATLLVEISPPEDVNTFPKKALDTIDGWIERGDGCAIYKNMEIGHPDAGHIKFMSYGSANAQLETAEPPQTAPDIGDEINWRYQLFDTYTGES